MNQLLIDYAIQPAACKESLKGSAV
jgi:hypothetical protein